MERPHTPGTTLNFSHRFPGTFIDEMDDRELLDLLPLLMSMSEVRPSLAAVLPLIN